MSIRVRSTDRGGAFVEKNIGVDIKDLNEAPTSLILSTDSIPENLPGESIVAAIVSTDSDSNIANGLLDSLNGVYESSNGSHNNIDIDFDGNITLGGLFEEHAEFSKELTGLAGRYGQSDYNFDLWLIDGGRMAVRRYDDNSGNWRHGGIEVEKNEIPPEYASMGNKYFRDIYDLTRRYLYPGLVTYEFAVGSGDDDNAAFCRW